MLRVNFPTGAGTPTILRDEDFPFGRDARAFLAAGAARRAAFGLFAVFFADPREDFAGLRMLLAAVLLMG